MESNTITITVKKPTEKTWAELLTYLVRINDPHKNPNAYNTLISLASYARKNGNLTKKQELIADILVETFGGINGKK